MGPTRQLACLSAFVIILSGCSTVMADKTWHGKHFIYISCSGLTSSWAHCYDRAEQICGTKNYEVIARSNQADEDSSEYPLGINPAGFSSRDTVILCDPPLADHKKLNLKLLKQFRNRH